MLTSALVRDNGLGLIRSYQTVTSPLKKTSGSMTGPTVSFCPASSVTSPVQIICVGKLSSAQAPSVLVL